jgi:ubiquinone/menaquinone biosynthesis C-methylase UbiE
MAVRRDRVCQFVADHFPQDAKILDLGCGAGVVMEQLIRRGYTVIGADRSADMLNLTRERLASYPAKAYELHQGTCEQLPFATHQFDVVLCVGVFGYIDDVVGALTEIRRVLRPGGRLVMSVRNPFNKLIFDPAGGLMAVYKKLRTRSRSGTNTVQTAPGRPRQFTIDIFQEPRSLIQGVSSCGYTLEYFTGFGFGPVAFNGKTLFPAHEIRMSDSLNALFDRLGMTGLSRWVGDVSIYSFFKSADADR